MDRDLRHASKILNSLAKRRPLVRNMADVYQTIFNLGKRSAAGQVHRSVFIENTEDQAVRAEITRLPDVFLHGGVFRIGVAEIGAAGTNHDEYTDSDASAYGGDQARGRRDATLEQIAA